MKNLQNMNIFGAHYCPRAARAQGSMARAWRALPVIIFFGNGQGGHWILPGRAGKTGTGMPIKHHYTQMFTLERGNHKAFWLTQEYAPAAFRPKIAI